MPSGRDPDGLRNAHPHSRSSIPNPNPFRSEASSRSLHCSAKTAAQPHRFINFREDYGYFGWRAAKISLTQNKKKKQCMGGGEYKKGKNAGGADARRTTRNDVA